MFKQLVFTAAMLGTAFVHGAAKNESALVPQLTSIASQFIGFTSKKAGSCVLLTPQHIEPDKDFPIIVVYSETAELKSEETLTNVAAKFAAIYQHPDFCKATFDKALLQMIRKYKIKSVYLGLDHYEVKLNAVILYIKLSELSLCSFASSPAYFTSPGVTYLQAECDTQYYKDPDTSELDSEITLGRWNGYGVPYFESDSDANVFPQKRAENIQQQRTASALNRFNLVIDIAKFKELRAEANKVNAVEKSPLNN